MGDKWNAVFGSYRKHISDGKGTAGNSKAHKGESHRAQTSRGEKQHRRGNKKYK